jgi:hypothetical protein
MSPAYKLIPLLILVGCGGGNGSANGVVGAGGDMASCVAGVGGVASPCAQPVHVEARDCVGGELAAFCGTASCASYADTLAFLGGSCDGDPSPHSVVRVGTCDSFRFIEVLGSGIGYKLLRFYDRGGSLVALEVGSDTNQYCGGASFAESYGPVPCCTMVTTEVICAHTGITC